MKQADVLYEKNIIEMKRLDEERTQEELFVVVYPSSTNKSEVKINIENKGDVQVKIVRVWYNNINYSVSEIIESMAQTNLGPFPVVLTNGTSYIFKVTTERGNVFSSATGTLYYSDGTWHTAELAISIYILSDKGQYYIKVVNSTLGIVEEWDSGGIIHDDVQKTIEVPESGSYTVTMKKKISGDYVELTASPVTVEILWPDGPPLVYVFADGEKTK
jgi:hypothetical protein